jgi:hypothetical protein
LCITSDKSPDGLNYAGSIDLKIAPSISGNLVVTIPIIDKELADLTLFDLELKPFWEKHWDSGSDWEQDVQSAIFNVFAKLPEFTLKFGRWESYLRINPDGTFSGHGSDIVFQDVDSSQTSDDRYWGDVSDFNGKFTINKKISNYEYSIKLDYLNIEGTVGEVKEEKLSESDEMEGEGIMTITTVEPLGFENADEFLLYLPGKSKEDLSESHLEKIELMLRAPEWEWREKEFEGSVNLPFYVLCNMEEEEDIGTFVAFTD